MNYVLLLYLYLASIQFNHWRVFKIINFKIFKLNFNERLLLMMLVKNDLSS